MLFNTGASLRGLFLIVILTLWMDSTIGISIQRDPPYPEVGMSVLLNVLDISGQIQSINWYKGLNPNPETQILNYNKNFQPPEVPGKAYFSEAKAFQNGSLLISDLKKIFEGNYTVQIQLTTQVQASIYLPVKGVAHIGVSSPVLLLGVLLVSTFTFL